MGYMQKTPQVFYGGQHKKIFAAWNGTIDLANPGLGDVYGDVTGSSAFTLSDSRATWPSSGVVNAPVAITAGVGKGQVRRIVSTSGTEMYLEEPWEILPDTTSAYQIGGIEWRYRSNWMRLSKSETCTQRRFQAMFEPAEVALTADLVFYADTLSTPEVQGRSMSSAEGGGIASVKGEATMVIDWTKESGVVQKQLPGHREHFIDGKRWTQFEVSGFTNQDQVRIYGFAYEGVVPDAGLPVAGEQNQ
jgi:hypothetical protein